MAAMPNLHWLCALQHVYIALQMFPPRYFAKFSPPGSPWRAFFCLQVGWRLLMAARLAGQHGALGCESWQGGPDGAGLQ